MPCLSSSILIKKINNTNRVFLINTAVEVFNFLSINVNLLFQFDIIDVDYIKFVWGTSIHKLLYSAILNLGNYKKN